MSFLYPRAVSISRRTQDNTVGAQGYSYQTAAREEVIASGLAAHIQFDRQGAVSPAHLPSDTAAMPLWKVILRKAAKGLVKSGDIITDDLDNRYQVFAADWNPLVTTCRAQILEV